LNAFHIWRLYSTTKMHFNSSYDAFRFNFKAKNINSTTFEKAKEKYKFVYAEKRDKTESDWIDFFYSNIVYKGIDWFGTMEEEPWLEYRKRTQSLSYRYKKDLSQFDLKLNDLLYNGPDELPPIILAHQANEIMIETVLILNILTNFVSEIKINDQMLWPEIKKKYIKATPFLNQKIKSKETFKLITLKTNSI